MPTQRVKNPVNSAESTTTRERILVAAARVLSLKGYSETRLADIAELAELRSPAIYHYFGSREALIAEVMAVGQRRLREHVEDALCAHMAATERIFRAIRAHLQVELELSEFATAVTRNLGQLPDEARGHLREEGGEYIQLWRNLLEEAWRAGAIRADLDLGAVRMLIMGALNWTTEWWNPEQGPLSTVIDTAQSLVCHGLGFATSHDVDDF